MSCRIHRIHEYLKGDNIINAAPGNSETRALAQERERERDIFVHSRVSIDDRPLTIDYPRRRDLSISTRLRIRAQDLNRV